ncbi:acetolactate synthase large subunit [Novosphingobium sp. TH158]|uniref:acetolactate synthase large subunit n=1 Tax=Novosphingobium sp. TH158 TaxID=2067455 RepID=UPI000C7D7507|nr:acetolactate synthase large subunit [Novosphingobium sp. TH158]PLK27809.1 acetolactate synthase large subunit [Novosphingobium sp. TH158]
MNGAEALVSTLLGQGVDTCFANPGTSEMHFLSALDNPAMKSVLCLFEGVATGAADGYFRMKESPAATLLHLGPGLANGLANIHNARRAGSGMVNVIGDHVTSHLKYDAPLTSDLEGLARPLSHWLRTTDGAHTLAHDALQAIEAARAGEIATLVLPGDASWGDAGQVPQFPRRQPERAAPPAERVDHVARMIRKADGPVLLVLADRACRGRGPELAGRIASATGCRIATQFFTNRIERGAGRVTLERIPYFVAAALEYLQPFRHIVTVETGEPIAFFAYPGLPSQLKHPEAQLHSLALPGEDGTMALEMLADALGARQAAVPWQERIETPVPQGAIDPTSIAHALAAAMPEHCILVDESLTSGRTSMALTCGALPHDTLQNMGGSIGFGTPVATGAAMASPGRRVFCLEGDGSMMYTLQSLWTHAREGLDVTTVVFANRKYKILEAEYANMGFGTPGPRAAEMMEIDRPTLDFVSLARGMGVPGVKVDTAEDFHAAMVRSCAESGPALIEVVM